MGRRRHVYSLSSDSDSDDGSSFRRKRKKGGFLKGQPVYTRLIVNASALVIAASAGWLLVKQFTSRSNEQMVCQGSSTGESSTDKFFECDVPPGYSLQNSVGKVPVRLDKVVKNGSFDPRWMWVLFPLGTLITIFLPGLFYYLVSARKIRQKEKKRRDKYKHLYKDNRRESKGLPREGLQARRDLETYARGIMTTSLIQRATTTSVIAPLGSESDYYY